MPDDLVNPLVRNIQERLPWLFSEYGFRIVNFSYSAKYFGTCEVTLESKSLRLVFVRDRGIGQVDLIARADPETSYRLSFIVGRIKGAHPDIGFEGVAFLLKENWTGIIEALGPKLAETKREHERLQLANKETFARLQDKIKLTPRGRVNMFKRTAIGSVLFRLLRYAEVALILWALYIVLNHRAA